MMEDDCQPLGGPITALLVTSSSVYGYEDATDEFVEVNSAWLRANPRKDLIVYADSADGANEAVEFVVGLGRPRLIDAVVRESMRYGRGSTIYPCPHTASIRTVRR